MSASLASIESILDMVRRFYDPRLPTSYSSRHMEILLNIIGVVIHETQYSVLCTTLPLIEPIYTIDKMIMISRPLVSYYINQPVYSPPMNIKFVKDADIFEDILPSSSSSSSSLIGTMAKRSMDPLWLSSNDVRLISGNRSCMHLQKDLFGKRFSEEENVRFAHTLRLCLMVSHWEQHHKNAVPYTDHSKFRPIEVANQHRRQSASVLSSSQRQQHDDDDEI